MKESEIRELMLAGSDRHKHLSDITRSMNTTPEYQEVEKNGGPEVIPTLLKMLKAEEGSGWVIMMMLHKIIGDGPMIPTEMQERYQLIRNAWLEWGEQKYGK